jgi:hypothetical protein
MPEWMDKDIGDRVEDQKKREEIAAGFEVALLCLSGDHCGRRSGSGGSPSQIASRFVRPYSLATPVRS